jgi:hypothetical protein
MYPSLEYPTDHSDDGGSTFIVDVVKLLPDCMVSRPGYIIPCVGNIT